MTMNLEHAPLLRDILMNMQFNDAAAIGKLGAAAIEKLVNIALWDDDRTKRQEAKEWLQRPCFGAVQEALVHKGRVYIYVRTGDAILPLQIGPVSREKQRKITYPFHEDGIEYS